MVQQKVQQWGQYLIVRLKARLVGVLNINYYIRAVGVNYPNAIRNWPYLIHPIKIHNNRKNKHDMVW